MNKVSYLRADSCSIFKKLIMKVKIVLLIIMIGISNVFAIDGYSQIARISLNLEDKSLEQVMDEIEKQSEFYFIFNQKQIDVTRLVDIQAENKLITEIIPVLFEGTGVNYKFFNRQILLTTDLENSLKLASPTPSNPQQFVVSGKITDASTNEPMPGVNVVVKGTTIGMLTDINGSFTLTVPSSNSILVCSFIGYNTQEVEIGGKSVINLSLLATLTSLEEVVVIGYGTVKRADLTGSVSSLPTKDIKDMAVTRVDQALIGKIAGVHVKAVSGEPGISPQIRIRGIGSISAGVDPLYVVDGFPTDNIDMINPNDIETIDILKDASATAIYGSRGSNGVVIISTRRGTGIGVNISFDTYYGLQEISMRPKYMNAMEAALYHYEGIRQNNLDVGNDVSGDPSSWKIAVPPTTLDVIEGRNTYDRFALDDVLRIAPVQSYQLSANGGTENVKFAVSGEYLDQVGIVVGSDLTRYSFRANLDAKLSQRASLRFNINPSFNDRNVIQASGASSSANDGVIGSALGVNPMYSVYNPDGSYFVFVPGLDMTTNATNAAALAREVIDKRKAASLLGNINLEYNVFKDIKLNAMVGTSLRSDKGYRFKPNIPAFFSYPAVGTDNAAFNYNWVTELTANYNKVIGSHNINFLVGFSSQKNTTESNTITSEAFPNNLVPTLSAVSNIIRSGSSSINEWSIVSYLGRLNYNYQNKYYLTTSLRTDGSSRFGTNRKYGLFPSAALAWRLTEEHFMAGITDYLNELKVRVSYGETGNNNIGNYDQYATINYDSYPLGGSAVGGYSQARLGNDVLTWEKQRQLNTGVDIAFLKSRLTINLDYFHSVNDGLLLEVNVPHITGFTTSLQNLGKVQNSGWELVLNSRNIVTNDFQWSTDFNISAFKNKVLKLGPTGDPIYGGSSHITMIGQPIGMFYGWIKDGIFLNQADVDEGPQWNPGGGDRSRPGDTKFRDVSGPDGVPDGIINTYDKTIMGSPYPDFYYGMTNRISYKTLSLSVSLQGSKGGQILCESRHASMSTRGRIPQLALQNNYWKSENDIGDGWTERPNNLPTGNTRGTYSTRFLDTATFLRINNITLSYVLPESLSKKVSVSSIRIYLTANNPFIFTKNQGFNPEASNLDNPLRPGREYSDYPIPRSLLVGINVGLKN